MMRTTLTLSMYGQYKRTRMLIYNDGDGRMWLHSDGRRQAVVTSR